MTMHAPRLPRRDRFLLTTTAAFIYLSVASAYAQAPVPTKTYTNPSLHYTVALPEGCRHDEGPGTLDAICAPGFDPERSARATSTSALVMQVAAQTVHEDAGKTARELASGYSENAFRGELPQTVCGESDGARARLDNVKQTIEESRVVYTASVVCPEISFLQVPERKALVRYIFSSSGRYRLVARAPVEQFQKSKQTIDAFFDSFRVTPAGNKNQ